MKDNGLFCHYLFFYFYHKFTFLEYILVMFFGVGGQVMKDKFMKILLAMSGAVFVSILMLFYAFIEVLKLL